MKNIILILALFVSTSLVSQKNYQTVNLINHNNLDWMFDLDSSEVRHYFFEEMSTKQDFDSIYQCVTHYSFMDHNIDYNNSLENGDIITINLTSDISKKQSYTIEHLYNGVTLFENDFIVGSFYESRNVIDFSFGLDLYIIREEIKSYKIQSIKSKLDGNEYKLNIEVLVTY